MQEFSELDNTIHELLNDQHKETVDKKTIIYQELATAEFLYYLKKGKVKVFKTHNDGKEYVTNIFSSGNFFGFNPLFENKKYSDTASVIETSEIYKIPKIDFLELIFKDKKVANLFFKILSKEVENKERQLLSFAYDTVRKRTATALVSLQNKFKESDKDEPTPINITRDDLARMVGTASETVIRCLKEFRQDNIIEVKGRLITVHNIEALKSIRY